MGLILNGCVSTSYMQWHVTWIFLCTVSAQTAFVYNWLIFQTTSWFRETGRNVRYSRNTATFCVRRDGGQLIIRHDRTSRTVDFSSSNKSNCFSTFFTVFYADCEHEILPVTNGYRVCLVYNLITQTSDQICAPRNHDLEMELLHLIENRDAPRKFVYILSHKYSQTSLSFKSLKTTDKGIARLLKNIAEPNNMVVYLAIFNKLKSGVGYGDPHKCAGCGCDCNLECRQCCNLDFLPKSHEDYWFPLWAQTSYTLTNFLSVVGEEI